MNPPSLNEKKHSALEGLEVVKLLKKEKADPRQTASGNRTIADLIFMIVNLWIFGVAALFLGETTKSCDT